MFQVINFLITYKCNLTTDSRMSPGLGEWSLHKGVLKGVLNLRTLVIYAQIVSSRGSL